MLWYKRLKILLFSVENNPLLGENSNAASHHPVVDYFPKTACSLMLIPYTSCYTTLTTLKIYPNTQTAQNVRFIIIIITLILVSVYKLTINV